jgi:hypothetical protein
MFLQSVVPELRFNARDDVRRTAAKRILSALSGSARPTCRKLQRFCCSGWRRTLEHLSIDANQLASIPSSSSKNETILIYPEKPERAAVPLLKWHLLDVPKDRWQSMPVMEFCCQDRLAAETQYRHADPRGASYSRDHGPISIYGPLVNVHAYPPSWAMDASRGYMHPRAVAVHRLTAEQTIWARLRTKVAPAAPKRLSSINGTPTCWDFARGRGA